MTSYHRLLDEIVAGESDPPAMVTALGLPRIDGWAPCRVWGTWEVDTVLVGPGGVFGGYLAAVADSFSGMCMYTVLADGQWLATRELSTRFLLPLRGGRVHTESTVIRSEGRRTWVDTVFRSEDGTTVCTAQAVQVTTVANWTGPAAPWRDRPAPTAGSA
ncbi:PaaI family thioesterase [Streptomyces sp. NPDC006372]|uniref:PaaI family thioesterase n=1 Tax=Streptomyces sp. NPDC006372 TaxID=3155599 RepID=UPI0033AC70A1